MAYSDTDFKGLELKGVTKLNRDELGRGAYGRFTRSSIVKRNVPLKKFTLFLSEWLDKYRCSQPSKCL